MDAITALVRCDGCGAEQPIGITPRASLNRLSRVATEDHGWDTSSGKFMCPSCHYDHAPKDHCPNKRTHDRFLDVADLFGHDKMGHRLLTAVLDSLLPHNAEEADAWEADNVINAFLQMGPDDIRDMRMVGPSAQARALVVQNKTKNKVG